MRYVYNCISRPRHALLRICDGVMAVSVTHGILRCYLRAVRVRVYRALFAFRTEARFLKISLWYFFASGKKRDPLAFTRHRIWPSIRVRQNPAKSLSRPVEHTLARTRESITKKEAYSTTFRKKRKTCCVRPPPLTTTTTKVQKSPPHPPRPALV